MVPVATASTVALAVAVAVVAAGLAAIDEIARCARRSVLT